MTAHPLADGTKDPFPGRTGLATMARSVKPESGRYEDQMAAGLHVAYERDASERVNRISSIPFALVHLVPFAIIWTGVAWRDIVVCAV